MKQTDAASTKREGEILFYVNGRWVPQSQAFVSVLDEGFRYGFTIFEGIRIVDGAIFRLDDHLERLWRSAKATRLDIPHSRDELRRICLQFVERNEILDGHMSLRVTPGLGGYGRDRVGGATVVLFGGPRDPLYEGKEGIRLKTASVRRIPPECIDPRIKNANYLNHVLALQEGKVAGVDDALLLDIRGFVSEMPWANVFIVKGKVLYTPTKYYVLDGITRATVAEIMKKEGHEVLEEDITLYDVYTADEAFACGSYTDIVSIVEVDGRAIGSGRAGPVTRKVMELYGKATRTDGPWVSRVLPRSA